MLMEPSKPNYIDDALNTIFGNCITNVKSLTNICSNSPREFWNLSDLLYPVFQCLPLTSKAFETFMLFLKLLSKGLYEIDKKLSSGLFCDYLLPKFAALMPHFPDRTECYMTVLSYFVPGDSPDRLHVLKLLKEKVNDISSFIQAMSVLINYEVELPQEVVDLYLYYSQIGLKNPSPGIRASAVCLLANLAERDLTAVLSCFEQILDLSNDTWWEVQAQLIRLLCTILSTANEEDGGIADAAVDIVCDIMNKGDTVNLLMVGLSYTSPLLKRYPKLDYSFIDTLLSLPTDYYRLLLTDIDNSINIFI